MDAKNVKVEVQEGQGLVRKLLVEVPPETVKTETEKQFADFRKKVTLKGFRKGKVPLSMIRSLYGNEVQATVADELVKSSYPEAIKESTLRVASYPNITALDFTDEGGLAYTAEVEVFPEIGPLSFDGLELKKGQTDVADIEVEEIAGFYRVRFSELKVVERELQENDVAVVNLEKLEDPNEIMKESAFTDVEIDLSREQTVKEFREILPGMKAGDEADIEVGYADDYPDERFAGAHIKYHCKVTAVKERLLPEFNDALAKQSGQAETALELKMKIRKELEQEKADIESNRLRREIIDLFCDKNSVPIPEALIEDYVKSAMKEAKTSTPHLNPEDMKDQYRESGEKSIRWNILFHRLADQEKIEVLPVDTENWINRLAESNNMTPEQTRQALTQSGRTDSLRESILEEKVLDFLIEKAKLVSDPA